MAEPPALPLTPGSLDEGSMSLLFQRWIAGACLGAASTTVAFVLGSGTHWRLDAGAVFAAALVHRGVAAPAAALAAALMAILLAPSVSSALWMAAAPLGLALLPVLRRVWFTPVDPSSARFLGRMALAAAAWAAVLAGVQSVDAVPRLETGLSIWLGIVTGALVVAPMAVALEHRVGPIRVAAIAVGIAALFEPLLLWPQFASLPRIPAFAAIGVVGFAAIHFSMRGQAGAALPLLLLLTGLAALTADTTPQALEAGVATVAFVVNALIAQRARYERAEAEQRVNQSLFDAMMRFLPVGLYRTAVDGTLRYANPMFRTLTGLTGESMANWRDVIHTEDRARVEDAWLRFQRGQAGFDEAYRVTPNGELRWIQVRLSPEYERGSVAGYIGTVTDITSQRLAEGARQRTEAHSRAILDSAVDAIVTIDESGIIRTFNPAAERMFGYPASDVIGRNVTVVMPEPHAHRHDEYLRRYLASGVGHIIGIGRELEGLHRDGRRIPIYLAVSEVFVDGTRHFTGILRDISRDRAAQEEIRRQHELLSVTVQNAPMGIATYRFGERFATVNRAFEQLTGYDDRSLASRTFVDLIDPADRPEFARLTAEAQHGSLTQFSLQLRLVRADGTHITVSTHNAVTHDAHGRPDLVIVQAEDMTAQILATEQERAHRDELTHFARLSTLGEMTAGIAHEINQPLTAISMYAQSGMRMLDAGNPNPARLREALEKLKVQSLRAGAVIDRIQRLVRHREGVREPIDLNELVTDILRLAESDARVNDMQITLDLADALPSVGADPIQLQQVLLNLVRNAIDAMQSIGGRNGRTVEIRTRAIDAGTVRVSVVDSGTGVAREFEPHLFTPFATTKEHGMGMGLSICRSIIEDHGGHLSFVNNPDHGATFYFDLPREFPSED